MNTTCLKRNEGNTVLVVLVAAVLVVGVAFVASGKLPSFGSNIATSEPRINPEPTSAYQIEVLEVSPGKTLSVESVALADSAMVVVLRDDKSNKTIIGKSSLLEAGKHDKVSVALNSSIVDGDVIYIRLMGKNGKYIENDQKITVEVTKNVGMMVSHYANEY